MTKPVRIKLETDKLCLARHIAQTAANYSVLVQAHNIDTSVEASLAEVLSALQTSTRGSVNWWSIYQA